MTATVAESGSMMSEVTAAFGWRLGTKLCSVATKIVVMIVLARLLPVRAFGLLSQVTMVAMLAKVVAELGLVPAIIQRRELSDGHIRVAFTISAVSGTALAACMWPTSPLIAHLL